MSPALVGGRVCSVCVLHGACGRDTNLPQTSCFISLKLYTAAECVIPAELPLNAPLLVVGGVEGAQISTYATNLTQWALSPAALVWSMLWVLPRLPLLHTIFWF